MSGGTRRGNGGVDGSVPSLETVPLYPDIFRMGGLGDNMTAKPGRRPRVPPKEEATFDTELQRYVTTSERRVTTLKESKK